MFRSPTICFLIPYFGKWPCWISLFLESCRKNSDINWILYTDCGLLDSCPVNVKMVEISFDDYCASVSRALNINFSPTNPYKLCDIKPALAYIHMQQILEFDFWAFGDIDLIYGNLRKYFTDARLKKNDLFSTHSRRISGHLCLIRNTAEMRMAFIKVKNWRHIFENKKHLAFDEGPFSKVFIRHKNSPAWIRKLAKVFDPWLRRAEFIEAFTTPNARIPWIDGTHQYPNYWIWDKGTLTNDIDGPREFPYFHFMVWKKGWNSTKLLFTIRPMKGCPDLKLKLSKTGFDFLQ